LKLEVEKVEFIIVPGDSPTLLGKHVAKKLEVLRVGLSVNQCNNDKPDQTLHALKKNTPEYSVA
jgi:hypothetical protein